MKERPILMSAPMVRALLDGSKTQTRRVCKDQDAIAFMAGDQDDPDNEGLGLRWGQLRDDDGRISKPQWLVFCADYLEEGAIGLGTAYGQAGDQLWVREAWRTVAESDGLPPRDLTAAHRIWHEADAYAGHFHQPGYGKLRPSMFMPRWASRITLEITSVRVERLQDINEADATDEGCKAIPFPGPWWQGYRADDNGELHHQQTIGEAPPDWMIEPKRMKPMRHLDRSARDAFRQLWLQINGLESWDANPWVWALEFKRITP